MISKIEKEPIKTMCPDYEEEKQLNIDTEISSYLSNTCDESVTEGVYPNREQEAKLDEPTEVYWCSSCKVPIIKQVDAINKKECPLCNSETRYLSKDLRPVFPEERLLVEAVKGKPFEYKDKSVWAVGSNYFIDGKKINISVQRMKDGDTTAIKKIIEENMEENASTYDVFNSTIKLFIQANKERLDFLKEEAHSFIKFARKNYKDEQIIVSFSGGKDSTVVSDLVVKALSNPGIIHIFGDTTLEFPLTLEYVKRFKINNPLSIVREAKNREQDFYKVCNEIGPPSRVMRWCCTMFKTGPINRRINAMFKNQSILTFYGIRKFESTSRSKYERIYDSPKIKKQRVATPIFYWKDIDIWLYMLAEEVDFNDAYRLGYDRVGCWCCPNNSERSHFLAKIYMPTECTQWRNYLVSFAKQIGKPDAENYVDSGNWKARQGGYGIKAAKDVKIVSKNCTTEENAIIYKLTSAVTDEFLNLFVPFGKVSKETGSKLLNEVLVLDLKTNVPIISIQPKNDEYDFSVKITTLNVEKHDDLQRMIGYQVRKYNACRKCLGCETVCKFNAITVSKYGYKIDENKCTRCKMCVTSKHLEYGCLMGKYLFSAASSGED